MDRLKRSADQLQCEEEKRTKIEPDQQRIDFTNAVPKDISKIIFDHLETLDALRCMEVSKVWNSICGDPSRSGWKEITFFSDSRKNPHCLNLPRYREIERLHFRGVTMTLEIEQIIGSKIQYNKLVLLNIESGSLHFPFSTSVIFGALKDNTSLRILSFRGYKITYENLKVIADALKVNRTLTFLDLGATGLSSKGGELIAEVLKFNQTLQSLNVPSNLLGVEGARSFGEMLEINQTLKELNLDWNEIKDNGAKFIADSLKINRSLTCLNFAFNEMTKEGTKLMQEVFKINPTLISMILKRDAPWLEGYQNR